MRWIIAAALAAMTYFYSTAAAFDPPPALEPATSPAPSTEPPPELAFIAALPVIFKGIAEADGSREYDSYFEFRLDTLRGRPDRLYIVIYDSRDRKRVRAVWTLQMVGEELLWRNFDR